MTSQMFRILGRRATLVSRHLGAASFVPPTQQTARAYGSSHISLVEAHVVEKNAAPPKASSPPPAKEQPERSAGSTKKHSNIAKQHKQKTNAPPLNVATKAKEKLSGLPTGSWVIIRNIPPMSTLTDLLQSINEVMDPLADVGIVDLDAVWKKGQVSMLPRDLQEWVRSAHIVLSSHGRPSGWRVEFCNRSAAHAFVESCRVNQFHCAWKPVNVEAWEQREGNTEPLNVSDSMIRVENVGDGVTVDHIRHLFRRYDMTREGPSVRVFSDESSHKLFVVHFADASWARAAVREMQGVHVRQHYLRLAQYPKQLISSPDDGC
jgi:hypothetical protein